MVKALQIYCFTPLSTDATFRQSCPKVLTGKGLAMRKAHSIGVLSSDISNILWLFEHLV